MSEKEILSSAVFLDRDGTITPEVGYVVDPNKLELLPGAADAINKLREAGFKVIVITNQSAVARGMMDIKTLEAINRRLSELLAVENTKLDGLYFCPHHPTEGSGEYTRACDCRKPASGLFLKAVKEHNIDLSTSYIIGDKLSDISMAAGLMAKGILVKTGYGKKELESLSELKNFALDSSQRFESASVSAPEDPHSGTKPDFIARDISEAISWIINETG